MSGHTHTYIHTHTYTHDNYSNPRCAHAQHRGLNVNVYTTVERGWLGNWSSRQTAGASESDTVKYSCHFMWCLSWRRTMYVTCSIP